MSSKSKSNGNKTNSNTNNSNTNISSSSSSSSILSVVGDGECLFNAVAYGIIYLSTGKLVSEKKYKPLAKVLRCKTVNLLRLQIKNLNMNTIQILSAEYNNSQKDFNEAKMIKRALKYTDKMSKSCTWGGHIELQVLGTIVQKYGYRGIQVHDAITKNLLMASSIIKNNNPIIHVVLYGVNNAEFGTHYDFWNKQSKSKKFASAKLKKCR
uniref:OTU domain-containing protein n=1 Tax=viral metagenome TaxID=1070528 RepID=A0A6C0F5M0_9ZZZZ